MKEKSIIDNSNITTLNIYLLFVIILVGVVIIYIYQNKKSKIENFDAIETVPITTNPQSPNPQTTIPIETIPQNLLALQNVNRNIQPDFTLPNININTLNTFPTQTTTQAPTPNNLSTSGNSNLGNLDNINIPDITTKNIVVQSLKDLQTGLQRFSNIDAPISINDDGNTCIVWGNYNNGKYKANDNNCIVVDSAGNGGNTNNIRKCLRANGGLATCNNLYSDGYIDRMNNIDTQPLIEQTQAKIIYNIGNTKLDLDSKSTAIDGFINDLVTKRNLENQQLYFINYNTDNLQEKQNNMNKINKELTDKKTELNLNQVSFSQFLDNNNKNENLKTTYYKIAIGLVISIIVVGVMYVLFSELL
jgi:hypothetical protein